MTRCCKGILYNSSLCCFYKFCELLDSFAVRACGLCNPSGRVRLDQTSRSMAQICRSKKQVHVKWVHIILLCRACICLLQCCLCNTTSKTFTCLLQSADVDKIGDEQYAASNTNSQTRYIKGSYVSWQLSLRLTYVFSSVVFHCRVAISLVQAYKDLISPVLPSVCRFLPSCSAYSVEAFEQFGASKGVVLMAWRILRCNPFRGGYQGQYDPPQWPPVGLEAIFRR